MKKDFKFYISLLERNLYRMAPSLLEWKTRFRFFRRCSVKRHRLSAPLIVSLTSYPPRFDTLPLTLKCLLSQSMAADRVVLWIAHQDKNALTPEILELQKSGLNIEYCADFRSFKKIIPTLQSHPDCFIVTADDDLYYWPTWLEELVDGSINHPGDVICHRMHQIRLGKDSLPLPYQNWTMESQSLEASPLNFQTGVGGVLYPPHVFHTDVMNTQLFNKLCPNADDVWLYWMMRLNQHIVRKANVRWFLHCWRNTQELALCNGNVFGGGNDEQVLEMIRTYGMPR